MYFLRATRPSTILSICGMHQRLAAGDRHHRRAAFVDRADALFRREVLLEHVAGILDLAASGASQVAAEQRLQHQHQRIALAALDPLLQDVRSNRPHLRNRNSHAANLVYRVSYQPSALSSLASGSSNLELVILSDESSEESKDLSSAKPRIPGTRTRTLFRFYLICGMMSMRRGIRRLAAALRAWRLCAKHINVALE